MKTRIREVRRARRMTLQEVADRCVPPTTPQTIGRLENGMRTVSVRWINRIAHAMDVEAAELVRLPDQKEIPLAAVMDQNGARAPRREETLLPPRPGDGLVALRVLAGHGEYRAGDELWLSRIPPEGFASALNRDVLVPRPDGRFILGRLIGRENGRIQLLPLGSGARQCVLADPLWIAVAVRLIRNL